jgi:hypothetical protein
MARIRDCQVARVERLLAERDREDPPKRASRAGPPSPEKRLSGARHPRDEPVRRSIFRTQLLNVSAT